MSGKRNGPPRHKPKGNPCKICGYSALVHIPTTPRKQHAFLGTDLACAKCGFPRERHHERKPQEREARYLGIDGEGQGEYPHLYVTLAVSDESGDFQHHIHNPQGLSTNQCFDFILGLPDDTRLFAYAFNYDLTKLLKDLPNETLYYLFRPELRKRRKGKSFSPCPVKWGDYKINLQGTKFTVKHKDGRKKVIWDIWKFYQGKFVKALKNWKVGTEEEWKLLQRMKDRRNEFDKEKQEDVLTYCYLECARMAGLARRLVDAHAKAGLKLKSFYGAGSSASAMLDVMGLRKKIVPCPEEMKNAVARAFFGGRFENALVGTVKGPIHSYDISSAYPYQLCFLPCLEHQRWEHTTNRNHLEGKRTALVRYRLSKPKSDLHWAPFPYREGSGAICYPQESPGGWVWLDEYLQGEKLFPNVEFQEAWVYQGNCECKPFERISSYYIERCRLGKEGPGIVLKLGCNSCYGKLAQSVGQGVFNSWVWAGLITSGCRAQCLQVLGLHRNPANLLMFATDGIQTLEKIDTPIPLDTGTGETGKPLGGWEYKLVPQGVFYARPGIYFPLNPQEDDIDSVRARGIGKGPLLENWKQVIKTWETEGIGSKVQLSELMRFVGAKTGISCEAHNKFNRSLDYGEWTVRPTDMTFDPMPKREKIMSDGRLKVRTIVEKGDKYSRPYNRAIKSRDGQVLNIQKILQEEQPDLGFSHA